jgi:hypothetical protein
VDEHRLLPHGSTRHGHDVADLLVLGLEHHRVVDVLVYDEGYDAEWSVWVLCRYLWYRLGTYL